ncbi:MAG: long-chain fatty acid--CoA ligase, partial [Chloroflexota bacterium]
MDKIWLKHYDDGVPASIDYPRIPLDRLLRDAAAKHPEHPATIFGGTVGSRVLDASLSYRALDQAVDSFAAGLQRLGVGPGDRVAVMLPNSPQFTIAAFATWRIGAIMVCCNPLYMPREIEHLLSDSGSETMIVMSSLYERVKQVRDKTSLKRVIVTNIKEYLPGVLRLLFTVARERKEGHRVDISGDANTFWFQDILGRGQAKPEEVAIDPDRTATLIYTGGTTGRPKGVQLSHYNLVSNAVVLSIWGGVREAEDIMVGVMPFFHSYGMAVGLLVPIHKALTTIQVPNPRDLPYVLASIAKHRATIYPGVPAMYVAFNNHPERDKYDLTSLRYATSAAAPLPPEVQEHFQAITGGKLVEAYGMTETSPAVSADPVNSPRAHSIGVPLPDTLLAIVDVETGEQEMPLGETGEIIVKGPQVMLGYWEQPTATANAIRPGPDGQPGWYFTGDIGFMDEDGYFHISDRKKDMIIAGGYNIYPAEVEAVLYEHPKVMEAAVIGVPDEKRGETVKAFIVAQEGQTMDKDEIVAFCKERMAAYKVPKMIEFR